MGHERDSQDSSPRCVVAFVAHPDDEAYSVAGTLALAARSGARVVVVCATCGEGGGDPRVRERELAASCAAIGAEPPCWLGWPDGGVGSLDAEEAGGQLREVLVDLAPDVVLSLGRDGAYGHADHLACTALLDEAVRQLEPMPRLLHVAFEPGLFKPVWRKLRRMLGADRVPIDDPGSLGAPPAGGQLRVDIESVAQTKRAAIAAHRSQLLSEDPLVFLVPGLVEALLSEERFQHVAGPSLPEGENDPLAGLE